MSAWPACRAVSSIRCSSSQRIETLAALGNQGASGSGKVSSRRAQRPYGRLGLRGDLLVEGQQRRDALALTGWKLSSQLLGRGGEVELPAVRLESAQPAPLGLRDMLEQPGERELAGRSGRCRLLLGQPEQRAADTAALCLEIRRAARRARRRVLRRAPLSGMVVTFRQEPPCSASLDDCHAMSPCGQVLSSSTSRGEEFPVRGVGSPADRSDGPQRESEGEAAARRAGSRSTWWW